MLRVGELHLGMMLAYHGLIRCAFLNVGVNVTWQ